MSCLLKTLLLVGGLTTTAAAAPVTFWFSGAITYINNPSNALPSGIVTGTPFSGRVTYEFIAGSYNTGFTNASGSRSNLYLTTLAGVSTLLQIGGHTLTNTATIPGLLTGSLHINDNYDNEDYFNFYTGFAGLALDGNIMTNSYWSLYLKDSTKTAYTSATFPTNPPTLAAFQAKRDFGWTLTDDQNNYIFSILGTLSTISTNELVALNFRRTGANTAQLGWPLAVSGYTLQSATNLATGQWTDVATPVTPLGMENTVTVSTTGTPKFYRLKK